MRRFSRYSRLRIWLWRLNRWLFKPPYPETVNHPDLPNCVSAGGWVILDTGKHFGTLAATRLGRDTVLLGVFRGLEQLGGGIVLTREQARTVLEMFPELPPPGCL